MSQDETRKEEIQAVYPTVAKTIADALGCDVDQVKLDVSLIEGLDAESIDFLDLVFRLERAFKLKIPRGKIIEDARGDLPEARVRAEGHRDRRRDAAPAQLLERGPGRPFRHADEGGRHPSPVHGRDFLQAGRPRSADRSHSGLSRYSRARRRARADVRAFQRILLRRSDHGAGCRPSARKAASWCPRTLSRFPSALTAEAVGQLAAWNAMAYLDFRCGPSPGWRRRFGSDPRCSRARGSTSRS